MTVNEIINTIKSLNRNKGAFYGFETFTKVGLNKCAYGNRKGEKRDFELYVHRTFSAKVGISYENTVNRMKERNGEVADFVAQKPFGMHHIEGEEGAYILQGDNNKEQYYLAVDRIGNQTAKYFINGKEVEGEYLREIFSKYGREKTSNEPIIWRHYKVEGIISIK
jgi:hypothetical protein